MRLSCVYTIPGLFRTASDGKLGGAWERGYLVYTQFQGFSALQAVESWAGPGNKGGPGNESILCIEKITLVLRPHASSLSLHHPR